MFKVLFLFLVGCGLSICQTVQTEIAYGVCRSIYSYQAICCAIPGTTPTMTVGVKLVREYSSGRCAEGATYYVSQNKDCLMITGLCYAEFSIYSVTVPAKTSAPTTTTKAPVTTAAPTTTTKAPVTTAAPTTTTKAPVTTAAPTTTTKAPVTTAAPTTTTKAPVTTAAPTTTTKAPTASTTTSSLKDVCGIANSAFRIIGGTTAATCEFPWMVTLYDQVHGSLCGGSIIDSTHILTAAHCVVDYDQTTKVKTISPAVNLIAFTGSSSITNATRRVITQVTPHEQYDPVYFVNDIAILTLSAPLNFTTCQRPICLVNASSSPQNATRCKVMGWGITSNGVTADISTNLLWVDVPVANDTECKSKYGVYSSATNFCAGSLGKDSCSGDSGGPLACRADDGKYYAQGVVSFGAADMCGQTLGVYTKVSSFIPWIQSKTGITV